jgi:hypothetical protein
MSLSNGRICHVANLDAALLREDVIEQLRGSIDNRPGELTPGC